MNEKITMINRFKWSLNPKKYGYLMKDKLGKAVLYLLILATFFGAIQGVTAVTTLGIIEKATAEAFKSGKLDFEMKNGNLKFASSPYKEEQGAVLLLVDTDKSIDELDSLRSIIVHKDLSTVILKDGVVVKSNSEEVIYKYSELGLDTFDFDSTMVAGVIEQIGLLKYLLFPFLILLKFVDMLFYVVMVSVAGVLGILINKQKLAYKNVFKLSIYSVTLPTILSLLLPIGRFTMFIGGIILIFGVNFAIYSELTDKE